MGGIWGSYKHQTYANGSVSQLNFPCQQKGEQRCVPNLQLGLYMLLSTWTVYAVFQTSMTPGAQEQACCYPGRRRRPGAGVVRGHAKLVLSAETTDEADARRMFDEMMIQDHERDGPGRLHGRSPTRSWWRRRRRSPQLYIYSGEFYSGGGDMDPGPCALDSRMRMHGMSGCPLERARSRGISRCRMRTGARACGRRLADGVGQSVSFSRSCLDSGAAPRLDDPPLESRRSWQRRLRPRRGRLHCALRPPRLPATTSTCAPRGRSTLPRPPWPSLAAPHPVSCPPQSCALLCAALWQNHPK